MLALKESLNDFCFPYRLWLLVVAYRGELFCLILHIFQLWVGGFCWFFFDGGFLFVLQSRIQDFFFIFYFLGKENC